MKYIMGSSSSSGSGAGEYLNPANRPLGAPSETLFGRDLAAAQSSETRVIACCWPAERSVRNLFNDLASSSVDFSGQGVEANDDCNTDEGPVSSCGLEVEGPGMAKLESFGLAFDACGADGFEK